jgi:hypothetical protein
LKEIHSVELYQQIPKSEEGPSDFPVPFTVRFSNGDLMLFWAKTAQERSIWTQTLAKYADHLTKQTDLNVESFAS